jgi:hypothetical protein
MLFKRLTVIQQFDRFHFLIANLEKTPHPTCYTLKKKGAV